MQNYEEAEKGTAVRKDPGHRPANWPPFPQKCVWPFKPCFHHDFRGELPAYGYAVTKHGYYYWCAYFFVLFWNMICSCVAMGTYSNADTGLVRRWPSPLHSFRWTTIDCLHTAVVGCRVSRLRTCSSLARWRTSAGSSHSTRQS